MIEELKKYDPEMELYDYSFNKIESVRFVEWVDTNWPYDQPNEMRIVIE